MSSEAGQIKHFFKNQTIFLTGGSGFLGKVLIEKLLRECQEIEKINVLLRKKKGKTPEQRFDELFNYACFDRLRAENTDIFYKVNLITGDCQQPNLGLSQQDIDVLIRETTCVIHAAANVKFDQSLKEAAHNVQSCRDLLEIAKHMKNLKVFLFVSTAYSNCILPHIKEEFYEPPLRAEQLLAIVNAVDEKTLIKITPTLLNKWPNTYIYSKSITEDVCKEASHELPVAIVRPAIVSSTVSEPMPGWIDNFYGVVGVSLAAALGVIRSLYAKGDNKAFIIPVDYVSNVVLAAAWKRANCTTTKIYNFVGDKRNILTWQEYMDVIEPHCWAAASEKVVWYFGFKLRANKIWHKICIFFQHTVVSYVVDFVLICLRRPPLAVNSYRRINKLLDSLSHFTTREWNFDDHNVIQLWNEMNENDKKTFWFSMEKMDWHSALRNGVFGGRLHLLKETPDTIPRGKRKLKILAVAYYSLLTLLWFLIYKFVMLVVGLFF